MSSSSSSPGAFTRLKLNNFSLPPTTKTLVGTVVATSLLFRYIVYSIYSSLAESGEKNIELDLILVPYLQLIPNYTLTNIWTIVTSIFICYSFSSLVAVVLTLGLVGRFVERSWSSKEFLKFLILIGSVSNLLTVITEIFISIAFSYDIKNKVINGNCFIFPAFLVIFKQLIPEHSLKLFNIVNIRVKHLTFSYLVVSVLVSVALSSLQPALQSWLGFYCSWIYLRFFQSNIVDPSLPQPNNVVGIQRVKGDASETFSLIHFFPIFTHTPLNFIFNNCYELAVDLNLINKFNENEIETSNLMASRRSKASASTGDDARTTAERRRQVALRVLEERIGESATAPAPAATQPAVDPAAPTSSTTETTDTTTAAPEETK